MSSNQQQPREREVVFCHQCENEWYRDEHGLVCPECQGDFVEVIEANNDPREEVPQPGAFGGFAPDPDEDDIDALRWQHTGPGHYHATFQRNFTFSPGQQPQAGQPGGLLGLIGQAIGPAIQGILGGQQGQQQRQQHQNEQQTVPGEQYGQPPQSPGPTGQTTTRHGSGPGFSYTITTSTRGGFGPRDANAPQPMQGQPEHLERMMTQMFMNIGVPMYGQHAHQPGGAIVFGMGPPPQMVASGPFEIGPLFRMFGIPADGVAGDHVYTQEGLDRIITQLMEQHQAGNAPPPASEEAIESLPRRKITKKDFGDGGKADCSICMDEAELGSEVTELPCHHWFHHDCIKMWLKEHDTCPHCRQGITPKEGESSNNRSRQPGQEPLHDTHSPAYHRPHVPGEYPFPRHTSANAGASGNTGASDSRRSASPRAERSGGMFSRMREAFSPRDNPPYPDPRGSGEGDKNP